MNVLPWPLPWWVWLAIFVGAMAVVVDLALQLIDEMNRENFPSVPLGVLGYAPPTPAAPPVVAPPPPRPRPISRSVPAVRGVGGRWEPILGGWPVYHQAVRLLRRNVRTGLAFAVDLVESERAEKLWPAFEAETYRSVVESLALTTSRADGETDEAYAARLTRGFVAFRGRLDAHVKPLRNPPFGRAPASDDRLSDARPFVLTRREFREIRKRFWASHHRLPTDAEVKVLAAR